MSQLVAPPRRDRRLNMAVAAALGLSAFALLLWTANDYGLTYDEPIYMSNTSLVTQWLAESARRAAAGDFAWPFRAETLDRYWPGRDLKPGTLKLVGAVINPLLGPMLRGLATGRVGALIFPSILVGALYAFCTPRWGRAAGVFGALGVLFMPHFFAQAHLFAMDVPVATLWTLSIMALVRLTETGRRCWIVASGAAFGLALGTKPNAFFIPIAFFAWALWRRRDVLKNGALALLAVGPIVFFGTWPWLWHAPLARLREYVEYYMIYEPVAVTYLGRDYVQQYAPWHYPWVLLAVTTPPLTFALAIVGIGIAARQVRRGDDLNALLLLCLGITLAFASLPTTPKHNGIRLFIQALPLLALFSAQGFAAAKLFLTRAVSRLSIGEALAPSRLAALALVVALLPAIRATLLTHPYQMSYYSSLIGGPSGAARRGMEATFWGDTYMSAIPLINALAPNATVWVSPPGTQSLLEFYQRVGAIRPDIRLRNDEPLPQADLAVFHNRRAELSPGARRLLERAKPVHVTELEGAPLLFVFGREGIEMAREGSASAPPAASAHRPP